MSKRTSSAAWVKGICGLLQDEGLDVQALFSDAGLDLAALDNPDERCPTEKISLLWELAATRSGNPAIGIAKPRKASLANFDVVGYAMMSCPNLLASFECLVRYLRIVSEAATVSIHENADGYLAELQLFGGEQPVPRQRFEFDMLTLLSFLRWISGRAFSPLLAEFASPTPANPQLYQDAFQCPVRFDASANRLLFDPADMTLPLPTHNPTLAKLHAQFAGQYLTRLDDKKTGQLVQEMITRKLPSGEPRREDIAGMLCIGDRTLRRRLQDEGTSFQKILDDTRRELAQQYLEQGRLSVGEMAYMLGFADQGTFFRVCRRWFGASPKQYRARYDGEK